MAEKAGGKEKANAGSVADQDLRLRRQESNYRLIKDGFGGAAVAALLVAAGYLLAPVAPWVAFGFRAIGKLGVVLGISAGLFGAGRNVVDSLKK